MNLSSSRRPTDIVGDLNQKALLGLASDQQPDDQPRSYRLPSIAELGDLFPELEVLELLGSGGMGCVFKARQKKLDRMVAIKILPRELARDDLFAERFGREARAMARLNHPNIVSIYDFGQIEDMYYLTMEYMDGMNLRDVIEANALDPHEALGVFIQVGNALAYAHEEGVVHRDIKPENILFNRQGHIALADFGLARLAMDSNCEISLTQTRQAMGTLNYMAPEQYEDPKTVDHRADIYALGVLLYELMTGKVPRGSFPPVSTICPTGPMVDEAIERALQVSPQDRYQSVTSLLLDLTEGVPALGPHVTDNGTFTNFMHLAATPLRKLEKAVNSNSPRKPEPVPEEPVTKWLPLHISTLIAFGIACATMTTSWGETHHIAFFDGRGALQFVFVLPILGVLFMLAYYEEKVHAVRWFALVFAGFVGLFMIPLAARGDGAGFYIYMGTMVVLAFEFTLATAGRLNRAMKRSAAIMRNSTDLNALFNSEEQDSKTTQGESEMQPNARS